MIKFFIVILITILLIFFIVQLILIQMREKEQYIMLNEVFPDARIISETEGIIEYNGKKFILGLSDLHRKRNFIYLLRLDTMSSYTVVDMRFRRQIIVR